MKSRAVAALVFAAATACVDTEPPATESVAQPLTYCLETVTATGVIPPYAAWQGAPNQLPAADAGQNQVWLLVPNNVQLTSYRLFQVNQQTKSVPFAATISAFDRRYALFYAAQRSGTIIQVRQPPPPPWPPIDPGAVVNIALQADLSYAAPY